MTHSPDVPEADPAAASAQAQDRRLWSRLSQAYEALLAKAPWWVLVLAGIVLVAVGIMLVVRPFSSLAALLIILALAFVLAGINELTSNKPDWAHIVAGLAWIIAGLMLLLWAGLTIEALTWVVAIALVVGGAARIIAAIRGTASGRIISLLHGAAAVVLGIVAATWPDVTVFVLAAVFGVQLALFGIQRIRDGYIKATSKNPSHSENPQPRTKPRAPWLRATGAVAGFAGALALLLVGIQLSGTPQPDDFYTPDQALPETPGVLLDSEPFDRTIPDNATAWRILYTTSSADDKIIAASALVAVPNNVDAPPVIAWAHGTTGFGQGCAPSLLAEPFVAGAMPALAESLENGWAIVATDYPGLGTEGVHPYLIGNAEGASVLDAVRAAQQLEAAAVSDTSVIWGHSQGGHAALWAGGMASTYAPELDIAGVAALAPASDLPVLLDGIKDSAMGTVFGGFALAAFAGTYDDVNTDDYVRPGARIMMHAIQNRCLTDPSTLVSLVTALAADQPVWSQSPDQGPVGAHAATNTPTLAIPVPLFIGQGGADPLVTPAMQGAWVAARCDEGQELEYKTYPGKDHMGVVSPGSDLIPDLLAWTTARLANEKAVSTCS